MKTRLSVLLWVLLVSTSLLAQTFRGTILGTVTDPQGAVVVGAKVTVHNVDTGLDRTTQTSADGSYSLPELPIGTYTVTVTQSGFQTAVTSKVAVNVAAERRVDVVFRTGQVSEKVEVSGETLPQVETTTDTLGTTFTAEQAKDLPLNGRDYQKMIFLTPGIAGSPDEITDSPGSYGIFSMNGARGRSNNFLLDGTDMNDGYRNDPAINEAGVFGTPATILPVDAISELNVISNFMPEYGRNAGATVNIVTKSGTNNLHGTLLEYFRNDALDARNYFNSVGSRAPFHNNQFGGSLGGPIVKDKTFFYVDYEGQRERVGVVTLACVPDPAQIAADGGATDPVIAALLATHNPWPTPNIPGVHSTDTGCVDPVTNTSHPNASLISPSYNNLTSAIAKIDHNFNSNNLLTGRYFIGDSTQSFPLSLTASGGQLPGFNTVTPTRVQMIALSYVHTLGPNQVNEVRYGWNRFAEGFFPQDAGFNPNSIGLCNVNSLAASCDSSGLPIILVSVTPSGSSSFFAQPGATSGDPRRRVDTNTHFVDNFSWKLNKHDLKFGFEFRRTSIQQHFDKYSRGRLRFSDLSSFLSGSLHDGFQYTGDTLRHTYENNYGFYLQDGFRLSPRLTVNYGLRWDYFGVVAEKNNLFSSATNLDPVAQTFTLTQVGQAGLNKLYEPDYRNFAPRASIAWDVTGRSKTVVRAGWGLFYDAFSQDFFLGHLPYPPFFDPGPAYNPVGPAPVLVSVNTTGKVSAGPVYDDSNDCQLKECDAFTFDRHIRTPYMENYNLNIQHQIGNNLALQIGYVGSQGHRLFRFRDLNQPDQATITASDIATAQSLGCYPAGGPNCVENNSYGVPRVYGGVFGDNNPFAAFYLMQEESTARSNYNSLQTSLRVTNWRGVSSIVNYSWSKSLDTASDGEDFSNNASQPTDSTRPNLEYGPSNFNVPHRFSWIFSYDLPRMGPGRLRNGWGFNSSVILQSGQPFQLNYNFEDDFSGSGEGNDRPDVVGPIVYHKHNPANFIDLTSFAIPCTITAFAQANGPTGTVDDCMPGTRHFGNMRRNSLSGPTYKQWDFALYKNTAITERLNMQLRAEFFNILNHPNFANPILPSFVADPASNLNASTCNCGFNIAGNHEVGNGGYQIAATGDVGIGNPFLGGGGPRGIQLAAKFTF
jgi:Carboxypeptidase regulatory-like domain/TonB dependent receptor-like, beta-barrel